MIYKGRAKRKPKPKPKPEAELLHPICDYCRLQFTVENRYPQNTRRFCKDAHRWAFNREGRKPIDWVLKKQEKHMRQIAREEATAVFATLMKGTPPVTPCP